MADTPLIVQVQRLLRRNQLALPGGMLLFSSILVLYKHFFVDSAVHDSTKMMFVILLTNLPIFYLDVKMPNSSDPLGTLTKFGPKVLVLHSIFLASRVDLLWAGSQVWMLNFTNVFGFIVCLGALFFGFQFHNCFLKHMDILSLLLLSGGSAVATEVVSSWSKVYYRNRVFAMDVLHTSSMYTELLTFLPACWILWRSEKKEESSRNTAAQGDVKTQTFAFAIFMIVFYMLEDVITLVYYREGWFMLGSHVFHYILLVDLSLFLISYAVDPESNKGTFLNRIAESFNDLV